MNLNWELLYRVLAILAPLAAAIPGIYAIRRQLIMEKVEKKKLIIEAESISADIASKYIDAAGNVQDIYTELLEELKKQLYRLECKIDILTEENVELKEELKELKEGVRILSKQVRELGQEPHFPKEE